MATETTPDAEQVAGDELETAEQAPDDAATDPEPRSVEVDHAPPRLTQAVALVAALVGVALTVPFAILAIPFGVAGLALVAASVFSLHSRGWLTAGIAMILLGTLITGAYGTLPPELLLVGVGATLVAWDVGQHGIVLGNQLGRQAPSQRNQVVHVASSAMVIGLVSAFAYAVFLLGGDGRPESAVAVAVIGLVVLTWTLRI